MALTQVQKDWVDEFMGQAILQDEFQQMESLKQMHLVQLEKALAQFRTEFKKAFELTIRGEKGKEIGKLLEKGGTQLDEVDMAEFIASEQKFSKENADLANRASIFIIEWTERLKKIEVERLKDPKSVQRVTVRLFTDQDIADELYTPLVRERMLPETLIGDIYSETQKMINRTNELYLQAVEQKKEAGELTPKMDRGKELLKMGGGLVTAASGFIGEAGELVGMSEGDVELVTNILDGVKMTGDVSENLYDLLKNSGFPDAADSLVDNIGNLLGHVIGMAIQDDDLANTIAYSYKAAAGGSKAGIYLAAGQPDKALECLAGGIESAVSAGDPKGDNRKLAIGATAAAMGLRNAGKGINIGQKLIDGDTAGVIDGLTSAMKSNFADAFKLEGAQKKTEEERTEHAEQSKEKLKEIDQYIDWSGVTLKTGVNVYTAAKQKDIAGGMSEILNAVSGQLTSILKSAGLDEKKAGVIGDSVSAGVQGPQIVACLIKNPPDVKGAFNCLGTGVEKALTGAAPGDTNMKNLGAGLKHLLQAGGSGIDLKDAFDEDPVNIKAATAAFENAAKNMGKIANDFAPPEEEEEEEESERVAFVDEEEEEEEDDPLPKELEGLNFSELFEGSIKQLEEIDEQALKDRQKKQQEEDALATVRGETSATEMVSLLEQSSHGELSSSDAVKIDTLIAQMVKDRMIIDMALKIAEGGMAVAAKFVPALGAGVNAIKLAANIMAAGERAQALYAWKKSTKDFEMAQNMLAAASQNFVRNQAEQFTYYTIQATFEAAQMIGEIVGASGIATGAGKALSAAAGAAKACQDLIRDYARKEDLESAWKLTCKAFNNPQNRKLALQARAMNPSLAKYCIAWGAYEKKDPLAKNAVRTIGLNESSLEHESTDCDKVVQYMETYFRDDLSLYREIEMDGDWLPDDISLSLKSWGSIKARALKNVELKNPDTARIDALLDSLEMEQALMGVAEVEDSALEFATAALSLTGLTSEDPPPEKEKLPDVEVANRIVKILDELNTEFFSYQPECSKTGEKVIKSVTKVLGIQCRTISGDLKKSLSKLEEANLALAK